MIEYLFVNGQYVTAEDVTGLREEIRRLEAEKCRLATEVERQSNMLAALNELAAMAKRETEEAMQQLRMQAEVARLDLDNLCKRRVLESREDLATLKGQVAEIQHLRAALAEYANHKNWGFSEYGRDQWCGQKMDGWVIAERALQNQPTDPKLE